jgi:hypothetical protein
LAARIAFAGVLASVSQNEEESKDECDRALERALDSIKHAFNGCMLTAGFAPTWKYRQKLVKQCEVDRRISTSNAKKDWEACYKEAIDERRRGN